MKSGSPSWTTAAYTKHKLKILAWSSLVFHCRHSSFNPSEAPPWDSRPVSGAGVVHYQLLHRPRSVPTALGPAPLVTIRYTLLVPVAFRTALILRGIDSTRCWKHSSEMLVHIGTIASRSCCRFVGCTSMM